jgi:Zn2+/Cd2+-exporting ATPase
MKFIKEHLFLIRFITALILLITSIIIKYATPNYILYISLPLTLVGYLIMAYDLVIEMFEGFKEKEIFSEETLTIIASLAAITIGIVSGEGEFIDGLAVVLFFQLGEHFEDYALTNSRKSIKSLMELRPDYVRLLIDGKEEVVDPSKAKIGDVFIVKPGEIVPLDGEIIDGKTMINTSSITGESLPRTATIEDKILSGVVNIESPITIKATKTYGDSTVAKILDLVENATNKKTKSEKFITKFAKIYTPIVISIAFAIAILPPLFFGIKDGNWTTWLNWIYRGASMLVISCPCAIVISIPMSYVVSIGIASKNKILIKGSTYLELIAKSNSIYLDKTGTITEGKFKIDKIETKNNINEKDLLNLAIAAESYSNHPIAKAITIDANLEEYKNDIKDYQQIDGKGVICQFKNKKLVVGNSKLFKKENLDFVESKEVGTIIYVAYDGEFLGNIVIRDTIKPNTIEAISLFKKSGIKNITMLTGDNKEIAEDIARKVGIENYQAELLPIDKTKTIENSMNKGIITMFVGDGVNDAPSLVLSDIGISMGSIGSDSAIEASDIVIMDDDLKRISYLKSLAKLNKFVVYWNLIFAISIKVATLILNMFGLLGQWAIVAAIFADVGVTIICCINSLLISLKRK